MTTEPTEAVIGEAPAPHVEPPPDAGAPGSTRAVVLVRRLVHAGFLLQLAGLLFFAWFLWHRGPLGIDFAIYAQAVTAIAHGNLDPGTTIVPSGFWAAPSFTSYPFWQSHFEILIWLLGPLWAIVRTPLALSVLQVGSVVGAGLVAFTWIDRILASRRLPPKLAPALLAGAGLILLVDPPAIYTIALDVHLEATATFFALLAGFDLWRGRTPRALVWLALCLACGDLGGLYAAGLGLSALLASPRTRRIGLLVLVLGVLWVALVGALGANRGSELDQFAYLAHRSRLPRGLPGALAVLHGVVTHPGRPLGVLRQRAHLIGTYLLEGGALGVLTAWGIGVPAAALASSGLSHTPLFVGEPFQEFPVLPFVLVGTATLLTWLAAAPRPRFVPRSIRAPRPLRLALVGLVALATGLAALTGEIHKLPRSTTDNALGGFLPAGEAATVRSVLARTPPDAEVIASLDISGRFAARPAIYLFSGPTLAIPVRRGPVVLVLDVAHFTPPAQAAPAVTVAQGLATAPLRTLAHSDGVWAVEWQQPRMTMASFP